MSIESARLIYPILVRLARESSQAAQGKLTLPWTTYEDLCLKCKDVGVKETARTIATKLLKPIQLACLDANHPDLTSLVIQKPKARGDVGNLIRPSDGWWEIYVQRGEISAAGDVPFWFERYRKARDYQDWPEAPFF